jgi:hypothetical protein
LATKFRVPENTRSTAGSAFEAEVVAATVGTTVAPGAEGPPGAVVAVDPGTAVAVEPAGVLEQAASAARAIRETTTFVIQELRRWFMVAPLSVTDN